MSVLHAALQHISFEVLRGNYPTSGICGVLRRYPLVPPEINEVAMLMKQWPEFSGSETYPVPGPKGKTAYEAYTGYGYGPINDEWRWSPRSEYGATRLRLLAFLINRTDPANIAAVHDHYEEGLDDG